MTLEMLPIRYSESRLMFLVPRTVLAARWWYSQTGVALSREMTPMEKDVLSTAQPASMDLLVASWSWLASWAAADVKDGWEAREVGLGTMGPGGRQSKEKLGDGDEAVAKAASVGAARTF
jgi:hypothetical protein